MQQPRAGSSTGAPHLQVPRWLHGTLIVLSCLMVLVVFVGPASWKMGFSAAHTEVMLDVFKDGHAPPGPIPSNVVTKYVPFPLVRFTHNLPAGFWAALVPVVLSPRLRTQRPRLHRLAGRTLLSLSALLMVGYLLMLPRGLSSAHLKPAAGVRSVTHVAAEVVLNLSAAWFLATGALALNAARRRRFTAHRAWALRHICCGMFVAVQRLLNVVQMVLPPLGLAEFVSEEQKLEGFHLSVVVAWGLAVAACEVALRQQRSSSAPAASVVSDKQL